MSTSTSKTYTVEHLDPELESWSALEYAAIARETHDSGSRFFLTSVPKELQLPPNLLIVDGLNVKHDSVESLFADTPEKKARVCLLDPAATQELSPNDGEKFDVFLFGGILGDDPPRDRTKELRAKGFEGRRLGPKQMTTDTAVRVTRMIVQDKVALDQIPYIDHPTIVVNRHESHDMPFRYVKDGEGNPVMPEGMVELIKKDAEKRIDDLL